MLREVTLEVTVGQTQAPQMEQCGETDVVGRRAQRRPEAGADLFVFLKDCSSLLFSLLHLRPTSNWDEERMARVELFSPLE